MASLTHALMADVLPLAQTFMAEGARRLAEQQARVAALEKAGRPTGLALQLLDVMEQTQRLHIEHVERLKRELAEPDYAPPLPYRFPPPRKFKNESGAPALIEREFRGLN